jgi:tRNA(fMet)-specific endonuclease VapC
VPLILVDTNVLSYEVKRDTRARLYEQHLEGQRLTISFVTLAELSSWAELYGWGERLRTRLETILADYFVLWPDTVTCHLWAEITAVCFRQGRRIAPNDAWIAAGALRYQIPLVTHNRRHFETVPNLQLISENG